MRIDLNHLKPGVRALLDNAGAADPRKPWPLGWQDVAAVDLGALAFRVESDPRWLPVRLIKEIKK